MSEKWKLQRYSEEKKRDGMESQWLWCDSKDGGGGTDKSIERENSLIFFLGNQNGAGGVHCMRWTLIDVGDLLIRRLIVAVNFSAAKDLNGKKNYERKKSTGF